MEENPNPTPTEEPRRTWIERIEVATDQLVNRVQEVVAEGNVRRLVIRQHGRTLLDLPLTVVAVGGAAGILWAPLLTALIAIAGLVTRVEVLVEREGPPPKGGPGEGPPEPA